MVDLFPCRSDKHEKDFYKGKDFCSACGQPFTSITPDGLKVVKWDKKNKRVVYLFEKPRG